MHLTLVPHTTSLIYHLSREYSKHASTIINRSRNLSLKAWSGSMDRMDSDNLQSCRKIQQATEMKLAL